MQGIRILNSTPSQIASGAVALRVADGLFLIANFEVIGGTGTVIFRDITTGAGRGIADIMAADTAITEAERMEEVAVAVADAGDF